MFNFIKQTEMKNFIFAMLGFLAMPLASLDVQASSVTENIPCKSELSAVDVGQQGVQWTTLEVVPNDCFLSEVTNIAFVIVNNPVMARQMKNKTAIRGEQISVPKIPFRNIYKSRYVTHYSYTALSKLITPY